MLHKEVVLKKDNILSFIVKLICSLSLFLWLSISHAEDLGRYISSEPIKLNDDLTIEAGVTVNFLGVLDVPKNVASSGRLATFYVGENIYNADAALFYKAIENAKETSIRYGKKVEDFSHEEWRKIVKEEEEKLVERMWKTGGLGMVLMGFMPWW